jgi:hypothetical protein
VQPNVAEALARIGRADARDDLTRERSRDDGHGWRQRRRNDLPLLGRRGQHPSPGALPERAADRADPSRRDPHAAVAQHHGSILETVGDGFYIAFARASDAVAAAVQPSWLSALKTGAKSARSGFAWPSTPEKPSAVARTSPVHPSIAARGSLALAHGGQVLLSRATSSLVRDGLPPEAGLRSMGEHRLRDLIEPEEVFQLLHTRLPDVFPPLRSADVRPNNLPAELTAFVGRERERAEAIRLLGASRLVTALDPVAWARRASLSRWQASSSASSSTAFFLSI